METERKIKYLCHTKNVVSRPALIAADHLLGMRVAILHDDFSICGGGEKLIGLLASGLQNRGCEVDIYTYDLSNETKRIIPRNICIHTLKDPSITNNEPAIQRYLFATSTLIKHYNVYLFSGHSSLCAAKHFNPNILYCHNIPKSESIVGRLNKDDVQSHVRAFNNSWFERFLEKAYSLKYKIIKTKVIAQKIDAIRFLSVNGSLIRNFRYLNYKFTYKHNYAHINMILTNSQNTKDKIKKTYNLDSHVVYPPIDTSQFQNKEAKNYWVSINRITPLKRIELQLRAFARLPTENLKIIGHIQNRTYFDELKTICSPNVEFLGIIEEQVMINLLAESKGLLFTAQDEDFGMSPVEAMAAGKPVIAPNEGGCKETIIDKETVILLDDIDSDKIVRAIKKLFQRLDIDPGIFVTTCQEQARRFDIKIFIDQVEHHIKQMVSKK